MKRILFLLAIPLILPACKAKPINPDIVFRYKMGDKALVFMSDKDNRLAPNLMYNFDPAMLEILPYEGKPMNSFNSFILEMGDNSKYLFDTGTGIRPQFNYPVAGLAPEEVTKIYLTHMHGDHIGAMLKNGKVVFPNATIYIARQEYDYWTDKEIINSFPSHKRGSFEYAGRFLEAYKGQLHLFSPGMLGDEGTEMEPGITAFLAPGHTPGHTVYLLETGKGKMLIWGDITHTTELQLRFPDVAVMYDVDPGQAIETRKKVLEYVADNDIMVAGMHIVYPGIGKVTRDKDGYYTFKPVKAPKRNNWEI